VDSTSVLCPGATLPAGLVQVTVAVPSATITSVTGPSPSPAILPEQLTCVPMVHITTHKVYESSVRVQQWLRYLCPTKSTPVILQMYMDLEYMVGGALMTGPKTLGRISQVDARPWWATFRTTFRPSGPS
jgi:hypothetical protein